MPGVKRCGIKVNPDGTLNEEGKPCALKAGHDLATEPHRPRIAIVVSDDDLSSITGSVAVVTDTTVLSEVRRTRSVSDSPLGQMAVKLVKGAYDAWVRGGKHLKWDDTPTLAVDIPKHLEDRFRSEIHRAAASEKQKATFGDSKAVGTDGKIVKIFFQVRDLPVRNDGKTAETEVKTDTPAPEAPVTPAQQAAAAAANARKERAAK